MDPKREEELKTIATAVMRAWNGAPGFNNAFWASHFGQYILTELEKVMYPAAVEAPKPVDNQPQPVVDPKN